MVSVLPAQGEVWWAEAEDKRRPVLVVTSRDAVSVLTWIIVAPVTRTIRQIPTEVRLGARHGLRRVRRLCRPGMAHISSRVPTGVGPVNQHTIGAGTAIGSGVGAAQPASSRSNITLACS